MGNTPARAKTSRRRDFASAPPGPGASPGAVADPSSASEVSPGRGGSFRDADPFAGNYHKVMLQGFHWRSCTHGADGGPSWYAEVRSRVSAMRSLGVEALWLPPPSHSVSPEGYLPQRLFDLDTHYGTKEELVALCADLRAAGIAPLADVVINHRCADTQDEHGRWRIFSNVTFPDGPVDSSVLGEGGVGEKASFDKSWGPWAIVKDDPHFDGEGASDTGDSFPPAPDLDHSNPRVRAELAAWLDWLRTDVGFEGWRFDYARGYAARFAKEYVERTTGPSALNVAEFWPEASWEEGGVLARCQDPMRQATCDWLDGAGGALAAFDFGTKAVLQEAVRRVEYWRLADDRGKPPGLIGWWPQRAVTFIDNHDTGGSGQAAGAEQGRLKDGSEGYGQGHWRFPPEHRMAGYAYILTHPGVPCLFWPHAMWAHDDAHAEAGAEIAALCAVRRSAGVAADAEVKILLAEADVYVARILGDAAELTVKLGPRYDMPEALVPEEGHRWELAASGHEYAVWSRPRE